MALKKKGMVVTGLLMGCFIAHQSGWASTTYAQLKGLLNPNDTVVNHFKGGVDIGVDEKFDKEDAKDWDGSSIVKEVKVKNDSLSPALIRVSIIASWVDEDGKPWAGDTNAVVINKNLASSGEEGWMDGQDGYYYYNKIVATGQSTNQTIIDTVSLDLKKIPEAQRDSYKNKKLIVNVKSEAVEATEAAYTTSWVTINDDIKLMLKNLCK